MTAPAAANMTTWSRTLVAPVILRPAKARVVCELPESLGSGSVVPPAGDARQRDRTTHNNRRGPKESPPEILDEEHDEDSEGSVCHQDLG